MHRNQGWIGVSLRHELSAEAANAMATVLDDVTDEEVDARYIRRRVDDWEKRVGDLYRTIGKWLPDDWISREGPSLCMQEEMMRRSDVPARQIPTLLLANASGKSAMLEPRGLWIIGGNGRVDMTCGDRHYLIVDMAGSFEEPVWLTASAEHRRERVSLTESWLRQALR